MSDILLAALIGLVLVFCLGLMLSMADWIGELASTVWGERGHFAGFLGTILFFFFTLIVYLKVTS